MRRLWPIYAVCAVLLVRGMACHPGQVRVASFNIENFPKSPGQEAGAFDAIRALDAEAIAVQEIMQPQRFAAAAKERLGPGWRFAYSPLGPEHKVGVLYDSEVLQLVSTRSWVATIVYPGGKPAFEARFRPRHGDREILRVISVHLKAGGDGEAVRRVQLLALRPVLLAAIASGDKVVLLGDFNATGQADREEIAALAAWTGSNWASKGLKCTSYWARNDGCVGTPLDHAITFAPAWDVTARGPCEEVGCDAAPRCPTFVERVSDHCPVTVDLP